MYLILLALLFVLNGCVNLPVETENIAKDERGVVSQAHFKLALFLLNQHYISQAKYHFLKAQTLNPGDPAVWYGLGYYYERVGEYKIADKNYQQAIILDPHSGAAHNNYGVFLYRCAQYRQAIAEFKMAVNDSHYENTASAYKNAGMAAMKLSDQTLAHYFFEKASYYDSH